MVPRRQFFLPDVRMLYKTKHTIFQFITLVYPFYLFSLIRISTIHSVGYRTFRTTNACSILTLGLESW